MHVGSAVFSGGAMAFTNVTFCGGRVDFSSTTSLAPEGFLLQSALLLLRRSYFLLRGCSQIRSPALARACHVCCVLLRR